MILLSLFPGIDLFGQAFEAEGHHVFRGPDPAIGTGDIRRFHVPRGVFAGIIGGSPCQDFSTVNRKPGSYSLEMLQEFIRCVEEGEPDWFLLENVASVPTFAVRGYSHQRIDARASEFGSRQNRLRHFQFGSRAGLILCLERPAVHHRQLERCCLASEGSKPNRRGWSRFCELQGLPPDFELPYFTQSASYKAVGNGVPIPMGRAFARAVKELAFPEDVTVCACSCGRRVTGKQKTATMACRQRLSRRNRDRAGNRRRRRVTIPA
jgi:DNA (cytosine-5)-methyltransferase 1